MPRFCANLNFLFTEVPLLERFAAAAKAGFKAVEIGNPYEASASDVAARLKAQRPRHGADQHHGRRRSKAASAVAARLQVARRTSTPMSRRRSPMPPPPAAS